jgi:hypothetical protein
MTTSGIEGLTIETHNWGKSAAFWLSLGYIVDFETGHGSGQLSHPSGGPHLFIVEKPEDEPLPAITPVVAIRDTGAFQRPRSGVVVSDFTPTHWGTVELVMRDPDGRTVSVQGPGADGTTFEGSTTGPS